MMLLHTMHIEKNQRENEHRQGKRREERQLPGTDRPRPRPQQIRATQKQTPHPLPRQSESPRHIPKAKRPRSRGKRCSVQRQSQNCGHHQYLVIRRVHRHHQHGQGQHQRGRAAEARPIGGLAAQSAEKKSTHEDCSRHKHPRNRPWSQQHGLVLGVAMVLSHRPHKHSQPARQSNLSAAPRKRTIDAAGKVVAPGFIDMLGQSELTILVDPRLPSKIFQGITSEITGEGGSIAPLNDAIIQSDRQGYEHFKITPDWRTFRQYFARLEKQGMGINLASYVGATQVRRMVLGDDDKQPTLAQLEQMQALVREAMKDGTVGVSTSLEYAPAPYAKTEELIALATEASKSGGIYSTHMRDESASVLEAIDEALRIGREAHIPVEIWHIKVAGKDNWGRMPEVVAKINAARAAGADVSADTYAYTAWYNGFSAFIPPWAHDGGDAKLVERLKDPVTRARIRKDMLAPSKEWDNEWQEIPG